MKIKEAYENSILITHLILVVVFTVAEIYILLKLLIEFL